MKRSIRALKKRLDFVTGNRIDRWLATIFLDYEGSIDFSAPEWQEVWFDDGLTVYRNCLTGMLASGIKYRKPLTAEQQIWL